MAGPDLICEILKRVSKQLEKQYQKKHRRGGQGLQAPWADHPEIRPAASPAGGENGRLGQAAPSANRTRLAEKS